MSKYYIRPQSECQNRILNVKLWFSASAWMSKNENEQRKTKSEKQKKKKKKKEKKRNEKRITKTRYIGLNLNVNLKQVSECQNKIFSFSANVKIGFWMLNVDVPPQFECRKTKREKWKRKTKSGKQKSKQLHLREKNIRIFYLKIFSFWW